MKSKIYLAFMASENSLEDIQELVEPVKTRFTGICALLHDCDDRSPESDYLVKVNNELGGGNIIYGNYVGRHDHSRNRILFETGIKHGDFIVTLDLLERIAPEFIDNLPNLIEQMQKKLIDVVYYYGKPYLIKFREDMYYRGNPHESLMAESPLRNIELSQYIPDESKVRVNMRPIKRTDPLHWVNHYARYYFLPNSNQCLLGLDHRPDDNFARRQNLREEVRQWLKENERDFTLDNFIEMYKVSEVSDRMKKFINNEKILQDVVRYKVWNETDMVDDHSWTKNFDKYL